MKIVIFAAGEGVRMRPLTLATPKPLLSYRGRTNLDHLFSLLPPEIDEVVITVRHLATKIKDYCGENFHGRKIHYVDGSAEGNALGFMAARNFFAPGERFAVAYGDEVFAGDEIGRCLKHTYSWICYEVADPTKVGIVTVDNHDKIVDLTEKPEKPISNLAADGFMVINADIFDYQLKKHPNGEYYFSDLMGQFIKNHDVFAVMGSPGHCQLTSPADLERLNLK
jgi:NDP-sugar pyrophosphorylase family protein